jgi:nucleoside-diphosphate-sugar epimerase
MVRTALVLGAGGFIGGHLARRLKDEGYRVRGVDIVPNPYFPALADEFLLGDLRSRAFVDRVLDESFDEVYQLAADMGGAGYIFTGENDAAVMHNSATINLNVADRASSVGVGRLFYSSSACIYPERNQTDPANPLTAEDSAYPAEPDSEYGWEKLFSERLFLSYRRNLGLDVRIARFHNIFGPFGTWSGGREKAPAAICRKVAQAPDGGTIEVWGDGRQTRSFLYIDECVEAVRRLMASDFLGPVNIGSAEMVTINALVGLVADVSGKRIKIEHVPGPLGVRGRSSDNTLISRELGWEPTRSLRDGLETTYAWIEEQVRSVA